jgi:hypothetical protein
MGMDQQLDLKLDVKEAPAIPQYSGRFSAMIFELNFVILVGISAWEFRDSWRDFEWLIH